MDQAPRGPMGPRPRPSSWAAGMAPFGRCRLAVVSTSPGRSPGSLQHPPTHFSGTALGAGTYTPTGTLAAPEWAEA
ncbi:MAG TPA: hypothetical protein VMH90_03425 [Thermoplasmata archaeon]|nr:hypothetical protein [Thermoplasmata archaeon]